MNYVRLKSSWFAAVKLVGVTLVAGAVLVAMPRPASAQGAGMPWHISPASGPVGTVVSLGGNIGSSCATQSPTVGLLFQRGPGQGQPNETISVPVAANGNWEARFVIPPFVGGMAMTRASAGADVTPGTWQFGVPRGCGTVDAFVDFQITGLAPVSSRVVGMAPTPDGHGYWLAQADGGVLSYGDAAFYGSLPALGVAPATPIEEIASTPDGHGYWLVGTDGGVFAFGDATFEGSLPGIGVNPVGLIVSMTPTPDGHGYWLVGADGGVFAFGDARYYGNAAGPGALATTTIVPGPNGQGYALLAATLPSAANFGSATLPPEPAIPLSALLSGGAITPDGNGYWEVGTDGGVFAFGDAAFLGSLGSAHLSPAAPIVGMAAAPSGGGYWLVGADGGVFAFGSAGFYGSAAS